MEFNSSTILEKLTAIAAQRQAREIDINELATLLSISPGKLVSLLTELEHRDEITMEISNKSDAASGNITYEGTVRLMRHEVD